MSRLSLGEEHQCDRCKAPIPPGEIAARVKGHWLCGVCWQLWGKARAEVVREALTKFMENKNGQRS